MPNLMMRLPRSIAFDVDCVDQGRPSIPKIAIDLCAGFDESANNQQPFLFDCQMNWRIARFIGSVDIRPSRNHGIDRIQIARPHGLRELFRIGHERTLPANDKAQQRRGLNELRLWESLYAPA